jgi:hypothetical protein
MSHKLVTIRLAGAMLAQAIDKCVADSTQDQPLHDTYIWNS